MSLARPWLLLLLALVPVLAWVEYRWRWGRPAMRFSDGKRLGVPGATSWAVLAYRALPAARLVGMALLVLAAAGPRRGEEVVVTPSEGIDIMLALDVSGTMRSVDFKPDNRLEVAKRKIAEFVKGRRNDRIGLVVFAAESFTQCPPTSDYGILLEFLESVDFGIVDENRTAIGMAIANSVNRLRDSKAKSKVIVLVTDGANNAGAIDPDTAAKIAATMDVRIHTIGVGREGQTMMPVQDPIFGRRYQPVRSDLDEGSLQRIAEITGGTFFRARDEEALGAIYKKIDAMEKSVVKERRYLLYRQRFAGWAWTGLFLLMGEFAARVLRLRRLP